MVRIIVLNYARPENVKLIIRTYIDHFPITVVNNSAVPFTYEDDRVTIIQMPTNHYCFQRWLTCYTTPEPLKLVIDDDLIISLDTINRMVKCNQLMVGIYGKSKVSMSENYQELKNHWCEPADVDFLVGSAILIKQAALDAIKNQVEKVGLPDRGDDIIISYLVKKKFKLKSLTTVAGTVLQLPEGDVGLNTHFSHYSKRWYVLQKFKNIAWTEDENIIT